VALSDGRLISVDKTGLTLVWEPSTPADPPTELDGLATSVAVLPDGPVVVGHGDGRVLGWVPHALGGPATELFRHSCGVTALAGCADARVVTGDAEGCVYVHDLTSPDRPKPEKVADHGRPVIGVRILPDGRVISADAEGLMIRRPGADNLRARIGVGVRAMATVTLSSGETLLVAVHPGSGLSLWSIPPAPQ